MPSILCLFALVLVISPWPAGSGQVGGGHLRTYTVVRQAPSPRVLADDSIRPLITIVSQPECPVRIVAVDSTKPNVTVTGSTVLERPGVWTVGVQNVTDQSVTELSLSVGVRGSGEGGSKTTQPWKGTLAPGATTRLAIPIGSGQTTLAGEPRIELLVERAVVGGRAYVYVPSGAAVVS